MAGERFRRALRGYDPDQVKAVLAARDARVAQLEREAKKLAEQAAEQERRLEQALGEGGQGGFGEVSPGRSGPSASGWKRSTVRRAGRRPGSG